MGFVSNILVLIPIFIVLVSAASMSSNGGSKLLKLSKQTKKIKKAHEYVVRVTVALWILVILSGIILIFTGLVATIPYLYGGVMIAYAIINIVFAGMIFYGADAARTSEDYKDGKENAESAFKTLLFCGLLMLLMSLFLIIYSVHTIRKYHSGVRVKTEIPMESLSKFCGKEHY